MPDGFTFRSGVTTVVDAGSSGWRNFPLFKEQTIDKAKTRVLALLNIVGTGMKSRFEEQDISDMNPEMTAYSIQKLYPNILVGIKAAHYWGDFTQVDLAVEAGKKAGVPVMVDFGEHDPPNSIESLFMQHLRPGDIFTHTYANGYKERETIVDQNGKLQAIHSESATTRNYFRRWAMEVGPSPGHRLFLPRNKALRQMSSVQICTHKA